MGDWNQAFKSGKLNVIARDKSIWKPWKAADGRRISNMVPIATNGAELSGGDTDKESSDHDNEFLEHY